MDAVLNHIRSVEVSGMPVERNTRRRRTPTDSPIIRFSMVSICNEAIICLVYVTPAVSLIKLNRFVELWERPVVQP